MYDAIIHPWFLPTFAAAVGLARVDYVVLLPQVQTCVERVLSRTGHGFTDEAATRMMRDDFAKSDVARRHILHGPTAAASDIAAAIARARPAGLLTYAVP